MSEKASLAIIGVFLGCCLNIVFLELIVKSDPGAGHLVTFLQFLFVACHGLVCTSKFLTVKPVIGMYDYATFVVMFFLANVLSNYAFNFSIPMTLHVIFRSGSLMANMIMGMIILRRSYDKWKHFSVVLITIGIIIATIATGSRLKEKSESGAEVKVGNEQGASILFWWSIGIAVLTAALFISARLGIYQEEIYKKYGKHPAEALFYTHALPLPAFLLLASSISEHMLIALHSEPMWCLGIIAPSQLVYMIGHMLTQFICIKSVYILSSECTSLTVTLVITLRKFASLLFSIVYFKNEFTTYHWTGTALVFIGTVIFTEILPKIKDALSNDSEKLANRLESPSKEPKSLLEIPLIHAERCD